MEARNHSLSEWFNRVRTGQVRLPRFQRHEAWSHNEVAGLIETVVRGLPAGAALILEVGDEEPFISRSIVGAPEPSERTVEHLLDGQQRLTALWRALHDLYPTRSYFLYLDEDEEHPDSGPAWMVYSVARWEREKDGELRRYPLWADDPVQLHGEGLLPVTLLLPGDLGDEVGRWADEAADGDVEQSRRIERQVMGLRAAASAYNIPFLALPAGTPKDVALDVFIKLNTSSVKLTAFDVVVAQFEAATDESMHELVEGVEHKAPGAERFRDAGTWVLDVAALLEERPPTQASYQRLDLPKVAEDWDHIVAGIEAAVRLLHDEAVFDADRLPTVAVLPVLAALHRSVPSEPDALGIATLILRKYLWRAFLTRRYEQSAGSRALQDYLGLDALLRGHEGSPPIFDEEQFPLPSVDELFAAGWPRRRDILARGVLAVSLRAGGRDLADDAKASAKSVAQREYHHLFPDAILTGDGELPASMSSRALNCGLITWRTNRKISAKEPLQYLRERAEASSLGEEAVRARLRSHLIPFEELSAAGGWTATDTRAEAIGDDYRAFLKARAEMMMKPIADLCAGTAPVEDWLSG